MYLGSLNMNLLKVLVIVTANLGVQWEQEREAHKMLCWRTHEQFTAALETERSCFWDTRCGFFFKPGIEMAAVTVKHEYSAIF